ncbi:MAG: GspH/FimT family pseudopilin [Hyphomonadaceae bacterium]
MSAIGNKRAHAEAGFSLVEAMATLFVVGLMASAVFLLAPGRDDETRLFAERFASRLAMASEESVIANKPVALVLSRDGYGFTRLDERGWTPIVQSALSFRAWPDHIGYELSGAESDARIDEGADTARPAVRFDATGASTPASISLSSGGAIWIVRVDGQGQVHVARES